MTPLHLFLDLGNTRIKWATAREFGTWLEHGAIDYDDVTQPFHPLCTLRPEVIVGCSVTTPKRHADLEALCQAQWKQSIHWFSVQRQALGVVNHCEDLRQQGPDRWASVLGARFLFPGQTLVIATLGTALTLDVLTQDSHFLGTLIAPGYQLMKRALVGGTARISDSSGNFRLTTFPQNTADAVETGVCTALYGMIEGLLRQVSCQLKCTPLLLLSGGDTDRVLPLLSMPFQHVDHLVLHGLSRHAFSNDTRPLSPINARL